jgi:hypothetical protein
LGSDINSVMEISDPRFKTFHLFPLAEILKEMLAMGQEAMGCSVEIEFAVDLHHTGTEEPKFATLQIRPMSSREEIANKTYRAKV